MSKESAIEVLSSLRSTLGSNLKPICGGAQSTLPPVFAHVVRRCSVYVSARPSVEALASLPTKSVPLTVEMSRRKVEFESLDGRVKPAVSVF